MEKIEVYMPSPHSEFSVFITYLDIVEGNKIYMNFNCDNEYGDGLTEAEFNMYIGNIKDYTVYSLFCRIVREILESAVCIYSFEEMSDEQFDIFKNNVIGITKDVYVREF